MNALLLAVVLAGVQVDGELSAPPLPSPGQVQPVQTPSTRGVSDVPVRKKSENGGRIASGVTLLAVGYVASIVNTTAYWFTDGIRHFGWFGIVGLPGGIIVSAIPIVGPAAALIGDLATSQYDQFSYPIRTIVNVASLAMQVTGLVLLLTIPRASTVEKDPFALTGFGAMPVNGGAVMALGGRFP